MPYAYIQTHTHILQKNKTEPNVCTYSSGICAYILRVNGVVQIKINFIRCELVFRSRIPVLNPGAKCELVKWLFFLSPLSLLVRIIVDAFFSLSVIWFFALFNSGLFRFHSNAQMYGRSMVECALCFCIFIFFSLFFVLFFFFLTFFFFVCVWKIVRVCRLVLVLCATM